MSTVLGNWTLLINKTSEITIEVIKSLSVVELWDHYCCRLLDTMNDNTGKYFREVTPRMYMEAITAAAAFLGADPNNLVLVQNATSVKLHELKLVLRAKPYIIV